MRDVLPRLDGNFPAGSPICGRRRKGGAAKRRRPRNRTCASAGGAQGPSGGAREDLERHARPCVDQSRRHFPKAGDGGGRQCSAPRACARRHETADKKAAPAPVATVSGIAPRPASPHARSGRNAGAARRRHSPRRQRNASPRNARRCDSASGAGTGDAAYAQPPRSSGGEGAARRRRSSDTVQRKPCGRRRLGRVCINQVA